MVEHEFEEASYWIDPDTKNVLMSPQIFEIVARMEDAYISNSLRTLIENLQTAAATHYNDISLFFSEEAAEMLDKYLQHEPIPNIIILELADKIERILKSDEKRKYL